MSAFDRHARKIAREDAAMPEELRDVLSPRPVNGAWRARGGHFASRTESELEASLERVHEARRAGVPVRDAAEGMRRERAGTSKLTAAQRREVRRMLEDGEASTRAEAVAWVLEMGDG